MDHRGDRPPWCSLPLGPLSRPRLPRLPARSHALSLPSASDFILFRGLLTIWGAGVVPPLHPEKGRRRNRRQELCVSEAVSMMTDRSGKSLLET